MQQTTLTQVPRQNNKATFAIRKIHNPESSWNMQKRQTLHLGANVKLSLLLIQESKSSSWVAVECSGARTTMAGTPIPNMACTSAETTPPPHNIAILMLDWIPQKIKNRGQLYTTFCGPRKWHRLMEKSWSDRLQTRLLGPRKWHKLS